MRRESFYIASKWENRFRVAELAKQLEALGHTISHKWFDIEAAYMQDAPVHARLDFRGVKECTIFVALFDLAWPYLNAYVELGIALGSDKPIYIIGEHDRSCLFTQLEPPDADIERFVSPESFVAYMRDRD